MSGALRAERAVPGPAHRPVALVTALYAVLAGVDVVLTDGTTRLLLTGTAALSAASVLVLLLRPPDRLAAWATATVAVVALSAHVAAAPSRPLVAVLLAVSAASAWAAVVAAGVRTHAAGDTATAGACVPTGAADAADSPPVPAVDEATAPAEPPLAPDRAQDAPAAPHDPRRKLVEVASVLVAGAAVSLVEPDGQGGLVVSASTEPGLTGVTFDAGSTSATEHTYRTGRRLFLPDPRQDPLVSPTHLALGSAESVLWQPVRVADVPCAVLVVAWPVRIEEISQPDVHAINLLAEEAAGFLAHESMLADLEHFESTDVLTGLDSRAAWDAQLAELMDRSREEAESLVVAIIDLDHFREFNLTHGQAAGDAHLARFARAARATLRCDGLIARWSGGEFSLALTAVTPEAAYRVLDRVRLAVPDGRTCSIGFAVWDHHERGGRLLTRAGRGLLQAKEAGRNQICQAS